MSLPNNTFFDINKLPKEYGILVFPISLARTGDKNGQSPLECFEYVKHFSPSKVSAPKIGLNMVYGDFLYLNSKDEATVLKHRFTKNVLSHKNAFQKIITKEQDRFQIQHAFSYEVWNQLYLDYDGDFNDELLRLKDYYLKSEELQKCIKDDVEYCNRELTEEQLNFFLEEHLLFYLISKGKVRLPNEYIQGREKWILWCYPGRPLKGEIYLYQKNYLNIDNPQNPYQNSRYDLESKKLIDFTRIDLDTYNYKYQ